MSTKSKTLHKTWPRLKESFVKQAFKTFAWDHFKQHLSSINLDDDGVAELFRYVRRSSDLLIKRPDFARETARFAFIAELCEFLEKERGAGAAQLLRAEMAVIERIEAGYKEILQTQEASDAAKLLPETQASAALRRSAYAYHELMEAFRSSSVRRKQVALQSFRIKRADGSAYSPDGILSGIVDITTMTLMLLGHRYKWFSSQKFLILPTQHEVTDDEIYKAGLTEVLAGSWRQWERMEQRCRYFDGEVRVFAGDDLPSWAPKTAERVVEYDQISETEVFDYFANERLNDRLIQTYLEMALQTNMLTKEAGIAAHLSLPPNAFVSAQEVHSSVSLSEILGYSIVDDKERPCGLRLVEWIRGYSTLICLADERYERDGESGLCFTIPRKTLVATLDRVGLKDGAAETFIDQTSLRSSSRDLFDQPLIRTLDGSLLVFGPGILNSDPARVTLSAIGNQSQQLSRKGSAFEQETLKFFEKQGFAAKSFKFKHHGEEFEFDVVVPWDDHIFILECKNRTLSGHNPAAAYYFSLEISSAIKQVRRLADALVKHADVVLKCTGIDVSNKSVVPCVVNSLPYAMEGDHDGIYVTDASGLKRFFQERNFHIIRPHILKGNMTVLHRTAMKALWKGDKPTPADLVAFLDNPLQLALMIGHAKANRHYFGLGNRTAAAVADLTHDEMTTASIAKIFSVDERWVERESEAVTKAIRETMRKRGQRLRKSADRAWRLQQERK